MIIQKLIHGMNYLLKLINVKDIYYVLIHFLKKWIITRSKKGTIHIWDNETLRYSKLLSKEGKKNYKKIFTIEKIEINKRH